MKIGTFKENVNAVYGLVAEEGFVVHGNLLSPVRNYPSELKEK